MIFIMIRSFFDFSPNFGPTFENECPGYDKKRMFCICNKYKYLKTELFFLSDFLIYRDRFKLIKDSDM